MPRPRTHFGPDDEDAFFATRDSLVAEYEAEIERRPARYAGANPFVAARMLDFKWGYADGRITAWTTVDLEDFLLDFVPRKVVVPEDEILRFVPAAKDFLAFLRQRRLLTGDPLATLVHHLDRLLEDFAEAMLDANRFGLGKTIAARMLADGVDFGAPGAVERWVAEHKAQPPEERAGPLPDPPDTERERLVLPAVELPSRGELEAAARSSAALARLAAFTRFVGPGRRLTKDGNLTLADGRELVALLEIGDPLDAGIGERQFRARSTTELPRLGLVFRWAKAAGFVKVRVGRVSATERGRRLGSDPVEDWGAAFEGFFRADPFELGPPRRGPFWCDVLAALLAELPLLLYVEAEPLEVRALKDDVWASIEDVYDLDRLPIETDTLRGLVDRDLEEDVVGRLVELGAVAVEDGRLSLTPLGRWGANRILRRGGHVAPIVGEHVLAPVDELLRACAQLPRDEAEREIRLWIEHHPWTAARDLATAARSTPSAPLAIRGLELVGPAAEPEVRALVEDPAVGVYARIWLVERGFEPPDSLSADLLLATLVEELIHFADEAGPLRAVARIASMEPAEAAQLGFVERLRSASHPRAGELLAMIGRYHPSGSVREAARRAGEGRGSDLH